MIADVAHQPGASPAPPIRAHRAVRAARRGSADTARLPRDRRRDRGIVDPRGPSLLRPSTATADTRSSRSSSGWSRWERAGRTPDVGSREARWTRSTSERCDRHGRSEHYGRHRFLTFDREPATRSPPSRSRTRPAQRLGPAAPWIDEAREDLRQEQRLARAAAEWEGSGRDPSFLVRGARLEQLGRGLRPRASRSVDPSGPT